MIWVDVTTSLAWSRPPVGIVRTEIECVRYVLYSIGDKEARLCYFDKYAGEFRELTEPQFEKINSLLTGNYAGAPNSTRNSSFYITVRREEYLVNIERVIAKFFGRSISYSLDPIENGLVRGWAFHRPFPNEKLRVKIQLNDVTVKELEASEFRPDLSAANFGDGKCAFSFPITELDGYLSQGQTQRFSVFVYGEHTRKTLIGSLTFDKIEAVDAYRAAAPTGRSITMSKEDVYLTGGLDWDNKDLTKIYELKSKMQFKMVGFCYDLIPFYFPHLCVGDVSNFFARYFTELSWCSDGIVCISKRSRDDLRNFVELAGSPMPNTKVIRLGSSVSKIKKSRPAARFQQLFKDGYILFVSTIERRKNHEVLYKAYVRLVERGFQNIPKLVFVGMRGWGVSDLINDITLDPRVKDRIVVYDDIGDDELSLLYQNCLFTVFPSLYEGWGLPVSESLAYGKYCVASGRGSIPEVAGELLEYIEPWDVEGWADQIQSLIEDPELLRSKVRKITTHFETDSWTSCIEEIFKFVHAVRHA